MMSRFELGEKPIHVMDVPRPFDFGDDHHLNAVSCLPHEPKHVIQKPGAVETVYARPQRRVAKVNLASDLNQPLSSVDLLVDSDRVFEVAEQDIDFARQLRELGSHLWIARVEKVDHARRPDRNLQKRRWRTNRERLGKVTWIAHNGPPRQPPTSPSHRLSVR